MSIDRTILIRPAPVPGREGTTTVEWCQCCKCKTWHMDGICEWWDSPEHQRRPTMAGCTARRGG